MEIVPKLRTKHEVDQMTRCGEYIKIFQMKGRSSVGRSVLVNEYIILTMSYTLFAMLGTRGVKT